MGDTILKVQFGISNPADIVAHSAVEVVNDKGQAVPGSVFDPRFGVIDNGKRCPTCKQTNVGCPGHFGHMRMARPVYLYQFFDNVRHLLQVVCMNCSHPYLPDEILETLPTETRMEDVREKTTNYKNKHRTCDTCNTPVFRKVDKVENSVASLEGRLFGSKDEEEEPAPVPIHPELVLRCFQRISDSHVEMLGYSKFSRPDWMMCTILAVPPLTVRPSVVMDDNQRMEDDLTHKLISIVRANQRLQDKIDKGENAEMLDECTKLLQYEVATYVDNDIKGLPQSTQRSGRPLKTLKSRMGAKTGRVRGNLMGKRVDFSARSVITPDANIALDELGVPLEIAMNLTIPEIVSNDNRDRLISMIRNGPTKHPGAKSVYLKDECKSISLRYVNPDTIALKNGDVVHRHMMDGDAVLFNRQPSLHKGSMECHRAVILPYSTFRLNLSSCRNYNADFENGK